MPSRVLILLCVCPARACLSACDVSVSLQSSSSSVGILIDTHTSLIRKMLIAVQQTEGIDTLETHMFAHTRSAQRGRKKGRACSPLFTAPPRNWLMLLARACVTVCLCVCVTGQWRDSQCAD